MTAPSQIVRGCAPALMTKNKRCDDGGATRPSKRQRLLACGTQGGESERFLPVLLYLKQALCWRGLENCLKEHLEAGHFTRFRELRQSRSTKHIWSGKVSTVKFDRLKRLARRLWDGYAIQKRSFPNWCRPETPAQVAGASRPNTFGEVCGKFVTWNIGTLKGKRPIVKHLLERENVLVLGLQETLRTAEQFPLRAMGYTVFEQVAPHPLGAAKRGLALIVKTILTPSQVGTVHPNFMFVCLPQPKGCQDWIIGNVYLPTQHAEKRSATRALRKALQLLHAEYADHKFLLMGDFNGTSEATLGNLRCPDLRALKFNGSAKSWYGRNQVNWSAIDYFLGNEIAGTDAGTCKVLRQWDDSDHWPVQVKVHLPKTTVKEEEKKRRKPLTKEQIRQIMVDGSWTTVLRDREEGSLSDIQFGDTLIQKTQEIIELTTKNDSSGNPTRLSSGGMLNRKEKKLIKRKQEAFQAWIAHAEIDVVGKTEKKAAWRAIQKDFKKEHRESGKRRWECFVQTGADGIRQGNMRELWGFANKVTGRSLRSLGPEAVKDHSGSVIYDLKGIVEVWQAHYEALGDDSDIRQLDAAYWKRKLRHTRKRSLLTALNDAITSDELLATLKCLKGRKAPGLSGIPVEVWKQIIEAPTCDFAKVFLDFCNTVFRQGPSPTMSESVIVSIFKDGDRHDPANYRGISLMDTALKVVCTILARRLSRELEKKRRLIREQGGFRSLEECVAQAAGLLDILQRRKQSGLDTWLAFVDFKKAFDLVPHEGLFAKCWKMGIRGSALGFIKKLYAVSTARARSGTTVSDSFPVRRGVRQGCPLSPILFLIFINDIYEGAPSGVTIPTWYGQMPRRCPGLLFADDEVTIAEDPAQLKEALCALDSWASTNAMKFGIHKCGIMTIRGNRSCLDQAPISFTLSSQPVPIVEEYKYLGIMICSDLTFTRHIERRVQKASTSLNFLTPVLRDWSIPFAIRRLMLTSLLVPILTYGCELSAVTEPSLKRLDQCLGKALKLILRMSEADRSTSLEAILIEFNLRPIADLLLVRRMRLFSKYLGRNKTWLARLASSRHRGNRTRQHNWIRVTREMMTRFQMANEQKMTPSIRKRILDTLDTERDRKRTCLGREPTSVTFQRDLRIAPTWAKPSHETAVNFGLTVLIKMRVNAFWTAQRRSRLPGGIRYRTHCPICFDNDPETIEHLLVRCCVWDTERQSSGLADLIDQVQQAKSGMEPRSRGSAGLNNRTVGMDQREPLADLGVQLLGGQLLENVANSHYSDESGLARVFEPICRFLGSVYHTRLRRFYGTGSDFLTNSRSRNR